MPEMNYS